MKIVVEGLMITTTGGIMITTTGKTQQELYLVANLGRLPVDLL